MSQLYIHSFYTNSTTKTKACIIYMHTPVTNEETVMAKMLLWSGLSSRRFLVHRKKWRNTTETGRLKLQFSMMKAVNIEYRQWPNIYMPHQTAFNYIMFFFCSYSAIYGTPIPISYGKTPTFLRVKFIVLGLKDDLPQPSDWW